MTFRIVIVDPPRLPDTFRRRVAELVGQRLTPRLCDVIRALQDEAIASGEFAANPVLREQLAGIMSQVREQEERWEEERLRNEDLNLQALAALRWRSRR